MLHNCHQPREWKEAGRIYQEYTDTLARREFACTRRLLPLNNDDQNNNNNNGISVSNIATGQRRALGSVGGTQSGPRRRRRRRRPMDRKACENERDATGRVNNTDSVLWG